MNRRDFFKSAPAVLIAPLTPKLKETAPLARTISLYDGQKYIPIGNSVNEKDIKSK